MNKERIAFNFVEDGEYAPKEGLPFVRRKNIAAIIKHDDEYLLLSWNEVGYKKSLVTGGVDDGENLEDAVKREVTEETGYSDFKRIDKVDCINISKFYVEHKNQNREAIYYPYLVELNSLKRDAINVHEEKEHTCIWVKKDKIKRYDIFENHMRMLESAMEIEE